MNIFITGGAGFIGSSLADNLLQKGHSVIVIDNLSPYYNPEIKKQNISQALKNPNYKFYLGDIEAPNDLQKIFEQNQIECIVHLAARAGVRPSIESPLAYAQTNIIGTMNILEAMKQYKIKKMCMASSSSVYGNCQADKFSEDLMIQKPISPYAATKSACEQLCYTYHHLYNLQIYMLRFFTVYGPRQRPDLAINKFADRIEKGIAIDMYGDGSSMRDYTYIDDIVAGIQGAINYDQTGYEIFNLGGGSPITLKEMISAIEKGLNKKAKINQMPMQPGDVDKTISDISKAKKLLGYTPQTSFSDGIKKFIAWQKQQNKYTDILQIPQAIGKSR